MTDEDFCRELCERTRLGKPTGHPEDCHCGMCEIFKRAMSALLAAVRITRSETLKECATRLREHEASDEGLHGHDDERGWWDCRTELAKEFEEKAMRLTAEDAGK